MSRVLVGPMPEDNNPVVPTPWTVGAQGWVRDAAGKEICWVRMDATTVDEDIELAKFICDAVNEKVARDSKESKPRYYTIRDCFYKVENGNVRLWSHCSRDWDVAARSLAEVENHGTLVLASDIPGLVRR